MSICNRCLGSGQNNGGVCPHCGGAGEYRPFKDVPTDELRTRQQSNYQAFVYTGDRAYADLAMRELRELNLGGLA